MSTSRHYFDSLIPSWLASDPGYLSALGAHLLDRMYAQGWEPVGWPAIGEAPGQVPPPIGMVLVRATIGVEEFDIDMADDAPPPAGQWYVHQVDEGTVHTVPLDDEIIHDLNPDCPCGPTPVPTPQENGAVGHVVSHHSLDGREQHESATGE